MNKPPHTDLPKILIVDDQFANVQALERILENLKITIIQAFSGKEALSAAIRHDFALILMDVQMPIMDGFETAKILMSNNKTTNIPIIFITAYSREEKDIWKGYETGAVDYIFKPVEPAILKSKVRIFLEIYEKKEIEIKYTKLKQANDELINKFKNQNELERLRQDEQREYDKSQAIISFQHYQAIAQSNDIVDVRKLPSINEEILTKLASGYKNLAYDYVKAIRIREERPSEQLIDFSHELANKHIRAKDVIQLHLELLKGYSENVATSSDEKSFSNDARLLLVELLGNLMDIYLFKSTKGGIKQIENEKE